VCPLFTDTRLAHVWSIISSDLADGLCLDVFDTLLVRTVPEPVGAFTLLGERLQREGRLPFGMTREVFAKLRVAAEVRAREHSTTSRGTVEARLLEIYRELSVALAHAGTPEELAALEVEVERSVCRADLGVADLIGAVNKLGKPVYLVSDTYFSAAQLRRILERPELQDRTFEGVFTSSDAATNKGAVLYVKPTPSADDPEDVNQQDDVPPPGDGLFGVMLAATSIPAARLVHLGDHPEADLRAARHAGLQAVLYSKLTPHLERVLDREGTAPLTLTDDDRLDREFGDFGLTAVRARVLARSDAAQVPAGLARYWETGATVFGPPLAGFAEWVVERAKAFGVTHISCLLREGDFLSQLITEHAAEAGLTVSTLWVSRQVCALSTVYEGTAAELEAFLSRRRAPTVGQLLEQLGVPVNDVPALSELVDVRLDLPGVAGQALEAIAAEPQVRGTIVVRAARLRERLLRYLDEQLPSSGLALVVDLGWGGTIQTLLSRILQSAGRPLHLVGLYLATNATGLERRLDGVEMEGYLASFGEPSRLFAPLMRSPEMLEQLCMPDYGSLVGFDQHLAPELSPLRMSRTQEAQKAAAQAGVKAFSREWLRYRRSENPIPSLDSDAARERVLRMVSRFVSRPTTEEALAFSAWSHDDNFGSAAVEGLVSDEMLRCLPYLTAVDLEKLSMQELYWPAGVATVVNPTLARIAALSLETGADLADLSPPAAAGPLEFYIDAGGDFVAGPKETVVSRSAADGLSLVRTRIAGEGVRRVRIDPNGRRGMVRIDWIRMSFHLASVVDPVVVEVRELASHPQVAVGGALLVQPSLLEINTDDPQIVYTLDPATQGGLTAGTYAVDIEVAFAFLAIRPEPLLVEHAVAPTSLSRRVVRKAVREIGSRL
jgi:FMN phosphatase YigB (HAD superfamily)